MWQHLMVPGYPSFGSLYWIEHLELEWKKGLGSEIVKVFKDYLFINLSGVSLLAEKCWYREVVMEGSLAFGGLVLGRWCSQPAEVV